MNYTEGKQGSYHMSFMLLSPKQSTVASNFLVLCLLTLLAYVVIDEPIGERVLV
jgi:hypothetical protein